jgi:protein involved in polysaccharide export with SLBB domain
MKQFLLSLILFILGVFAPPSFAQIVAGRGIQVSIQGVPSEEKGRIDGLYSVSASGTIQMPLLNRELNIGGMTPTQAAAKIQAAYKDAEIYSTATFQILTSASDSVRTDVVTISSNVRAPGPKPYTPGMTLLQALAAGGGATEFGDLRKVVLIRGSKSKVYNLNNENDRSVQVQPNDTIDVPERSWIPGR